ncbi:MAG: hypothetical protein IT548_12150 [Alphaproteobacteria bacterium]|nr:hypothetical protein [Alphaproteobacteria bacterium]
MALLTDNDIFGSPALLSDADLFGPTSAGLLSDNDLFGPDEPGAISRGFVTGMLQQNPTTMAEAFEGLSYRAPEQFRSGLQSAAADTRKLAALSPDAYKTKSGSLWDVGGVSDAMTWAGERLGEGLASMVPPITTGLAGGSDRAARRRQDRRARGCTRRSRRAVCRPQLRRALPRLERGRRRAGERV